MKVSRDSAQHLLDQIQAYEENYFNVEELVEESQSKHEALAMVERMKKEMAQVITPTLHSPILIVYMYMYMYMYMYVLILANLMRDPYNVKLKVMHRYSVIIK